MRGEVQEIRGILRHATAQLLKPEHPTVALADVVADGELRKKFRTMTRADCAILANLCNARLRVVATEMQLAEQAELEGRLAEVEKTLLQRRAYGA